MTSHQLKFYFWLLFIFVIIDAILIALSYEYRNIFGMVDGTGSYGYAIRTTPTIILVLFYAKICYKLLRGEVPNQQFLIIHSIFFSSLALIMCFPWLYFFAVLTPIGVLYLSSIIFFKSNGYYIACGLSLMFFFANMIIAITNIRNKQCLK